LKQYQDTLKTENSLFLTEDLMKVVDTIYRYPLRTTATDALNRQLKMGISDEALAELCINLYKEDRLCVIHDNTHEHEEPRIICSMGLFEKSL